MADLIETDTALESRKAPDSDRMRKKHDQIMRRFDECAWPTMENRRESLIARRFITIPGAQWEGEWGEQFDNSIKLESDNVGKGVQKIERDYRENRIVPDFRPDGPRADEKTAETLDGLHRADSYRYKSQQARDNAVFEAIAGGMGAYRLTNELEDPRDKDNDHQRINPAALIVDADQTVFFDIGAKLYDKSDASFAFVRTSYTKEAFEEKFDDCTTDFPEGTFWKVRDWFRPDTVTIAEYYEREDVDDTLYIFTHELSGEEVRLWGSDMERGTVADYRKDGYKVRKQERKRCRVRKYLVSGAEILEDCGHIAGECIPIVPVYGRRYFVDGIERWKGHVQDRMDDQRLLNSCLSKLAETNSLAPREVPIFAPEQIDPILADEWANANIKRSPYLLAHPLWSPDGQSIISAGPVGKVDPPQLAPVTATLLQFAKANLTEDLQDADEVKANTSAEAMDLAATRVDAKSGIYLDNIRQSVQREGEIYFSMASEVYVEEGREVETMDEEGSDGRAVLAQPYTDPNTGSFLTINDFTTSRYKVIVSVTEATATRRDKTVKAMLNIASVAQSAQDMEMAQAALLTAVLNTDGEGSDDFIEWARKRAVSQGLAKPTEEEQAAMEEAAANQQPDPLQQVAEAQAKDFEASAQKKIAEVAETESNTRLLDAKRIETLSKAAANDMGAPEGAKVPAPMPQPPKPGDAPNFLRNGSF